MPGLLVAFGGFTLALAGCGGSGSGDNKPSIPKSYRRKDLPDVFQGFRVPNVASEPTDHQQAIASDLLRRIEREEETPVGSFSDQQAGKYIVRLGRIVRERTRADYGCNDDRGAELLENLCARYR